MRWVSLRWSGHALARLRQRSNLSREDAEKLLFAGDFPTRKMRSLINRLCPVAVCLGANKGRCYVVNKETRFVAVLQARDIAAYDVVTVFFLTKEQADSVKKKPKAKRSALGNGAGTR